RHVFLTGGTGYLGSRLIPRLLSRGHRVRALVRPGSEARLPAGAEPVPGNALDASTFRDAVAPADTLVHLVGVSHPGPSKAPLVRPRPRTSLADPAPAAGLPPREAAADAGDGPTARLRDARSDARGAHGGCGIVSSIGDEDRDGARDPGYSPSYALSSRSSA